MRNGFSRTVLGTWILAVVCAFSASAAEPTAGKRKPKKFEHVPGELVVKVRNHSGLTAMGATDLVQKTLIAKLGQDRIKSVEAFRTNKTLQLVRLKKDGDVKKAIQVLEDGSDFKYAEPNYIYRHQLVRTRDETTPPPVTPIVNDPEFSKLWGLKNDGQTDDAGQVGTPGSDIEVTPLWQQGHFGSRKVKVAVIDTGIDWTHPDLQANLFTNEGESGDKANNGIDDDGNGFIDDVHGWNFAANTNNSSDDHSHGTHCAGTIGGIGNNNLGVAGINWEVTLMPVKFLDASGGGTLAAAVESINYATMMGFKIMSNSWGGGGYSQALYDAIKAANDKGVLFVAAAGNDANDNDANPSYPASYEIPNIVSVAATDNQDHLASFSNYGAKSVHVAAPGVKIWSTVMGGGYKAFSGTSMATPHVSGVAALLWADFPEMTAAEIKDRLIRTSDYVPGLRKRSVSRGRVNALSAYNNVEPIVDEPDPAAWKPVAYSVETPHPYELSKTYTFDISHPGAKYIRVHFSKFATENHYDAVSFVDASGTAVETLTGSHDDYTTEYVSGENAKLVLKSDYVQTDFGFTVDRIEVIE